MTSKGDSLSNQLSNVSLVKSRAPKIYARLNANSYLVEDKKFFAEIPKEIEICEIPLFFTEKEIIACQKLSLNHYLLFQHDKYWNNFLPEFIRNSVPYGHAKKYVSNLKICISSLLKINATDKLEFLFQSEKIQTWIMSERIKINSIISENISAFDLEINLSCPILASYLSKGLIDESQIISITEEHDFLKHEIIVNWIEQRKITINEILETFHYDSIRNLDCPFIMEYYTENKLTEQEVIHCSKQARKFFENGEIQRAIQYDEISPRQICQLYPL